VVWTGCVEEEEGEVREGIESGEECLRIESRRVNWRMFIAKGKIAMTNTTWPERDSLMKQKEKQSEKGEKKDQRRVRFTRLKRLEELTNQLRNL